MKTTHKAAYQQLTSTFPAELIKKWENKVEKWENNPSAPNPYTEPAIGNELSLILQHISDGNVLGLTLQDVQLELSKEEAAEASSGNHQTHKVSMTGFLTMGLELEDRQYVINFIARLLFLLTKKIQVSAPSRNFREEET